MNKAVYTTMSMFVIAALTGCVVGPQGKNTDPMSQFACVDRRNALDENFGNFDPEAEEMTSAYIDNPIFPTRLLALLKDRSKCNLLNVGEKQEWHMEVGDIIVVDPTATNGYSQAILAYDAAHPLVLEDNPSRQSGIDSIPEGELGPTEYVHVVGWLPIPQIDGTEVLSFGHGYVFFDTQTKKQSLHFIAFDRNTIEYQFPMSKFGFDLERGSCNPSGSCNKSIYIRKTSGTDTNIAIVGTSEAGGALVAPTATPKVQGDVLNKQRLVDLDSLFEKLGTTADDPYRWHKLIEKANAFRANGLGPVEFARSIGLGRRTMRNVLKFAQRYVNAIDNTKEFA